MKYFVVADVHGFFSCMKEALDKEGYDPSNKEHFFISCGDLFDRGLEANDCLDFVTSIPKERRIFIDGNHEDLLIDLITKKRSYTESDIHNGTLETIAQLAHVNNWTDFIYDSNSILNKLSKNEKLHTYLNELKDYYETEHFVFVHGWIPRMDNYDYLNWRNADKNEWDSARWYCGFNDWEYMQSLKTKEEKTIVCGHWHTAYAHARYHHVGVDLKDSEGDYTKCCFDIFKDEGIVGLDACTVVSNKVNVFVVEDDPF